MSKYIVVPREVDALKIQNVQPLENRGQLVSVKSGIVLILEDGSTFTVTPDMDVFTLDSLPSAGDFLVHDSAVGFSYIVPAAKFASVFQLAA
jgi:hypothetical protein